MSNIYVPHKSTFDLACDLVCACTARDITVCVCVCAGGRGGGGPPAPGLRGRHPPPTHQDARHRTQGHKTHQLPHYLHRRHLQDQST